jgi:hypothetical protein
MRVLLFFWFIGLSSFIYSQNRFETYKPIGFDIPEYTPNYGADNYDLEKKFAEIAKKKQAEEQEKIKALLKVIYKGKIHLYGGRNEDVYLGCLNCSSDDQLSVWSMDGVYGLNGETSIWNEYNIYGGILSQYSPWNNIASNPPIIVDFDGNFYGYFTKNNGITNRTKAEWLINLLEESDPKLHFVEIRNIIDESNH